MKEIGQAKFAAVAAQKTKSAKPAKKLAKATNDGSNKLSALNAAAKLLTETNEPMNCKEWIDAMAAKC